MKVAISVPDRLFRAADRTARRMRVPRSQLYARALEAYLKHAERPDVTERLNAVYANNKRTRPDEAWLAHGLDVLRRTEWEE
jgi:metal-responsive CopG/Arc/MetJ family transcriptional regulator